MSQHTYINSNNWAFYVSKIQASCIHFNICPDQLFSVETYLGPLIESLQTFFASIQHQIVVAR